MTGYADKTVRLSHDRQGAVRFAMEVDFLADGTWYAYHTIVGPGRPDRSPHLPGRLLCPLGPVQDRHRLPGDRLAALCVRSLLARPDRPPHPGGSAAGRSSRRKLRSL